jgi:hypothetical protein
MIIIRKAPEWIIIRIWIILKIFIMVVVLSLGVILSCSWETKARTFNILSPNFKTALILHMDQKSIYYYGIIKP